MTNARAIINGAFDLIGVKDPGEALKAADVQDGLRRLNNFVSSLITQNLTTLAITRNVFPLISNKQYYTIGVGGDFNIDRPVSIDHVGLLLNGIGSPVTVTSITSSGSVATATLTAHGYSSGAQVLMEGATQPAYNGPFTITVTGANTFTYPIQGQTTSPATGTLTVTLFADNPIEIPRVLLTEEAYQQLQVKGQTSQQFTCVYYSATEPLGTVFLWPMPNTSVNQLVLYSDYQFTAFADLFTQYSWPTLPGYAEMLEYGLAKRLCAPYGQMQNYGEVATMASDALRLIKRANYRLVDLSVDPALTSDRTGWYNIQTGQGG